jgi:hypothetical protein
MDIFKPDEHGQFRSFLQCRKLPVPLDDDSVEVLREVVSGPVKVAVKTFDMQKALQRTGGPATHSITANFLF